MPNKTKAALQGRQCQRIKLKPGQIITLIDQVKLTPPLAEFNLVRVLTEGGIPPLEQNQHVSRVHNCTLEPNQSVISDGEIPPTVTAPLAQFDLVSEGIPPTVLETAVVPVVTFYSIRGKAPVTGNPVSAIEGIPPVGVKGYPASSHTPIGQSFGSSLAFLRCSLLSLRPQASSTHDEKLAPGLSFFSCSTLASILSRTSCGNRMFLSCDLLFLFPVAIGKPVVNGCCVYTQYRSGEVKKRVDLSTHHELRYLHTLSTGDAQITKPGSGGTLTGPLTTNDNQRIEVAMLDHITPLTGRNSLTPNKFTWRFLALNRHDKKAKPCRLSVEAYTEQEARRELAPHFILSLAVRLPVQEVSHV